MKSEAKIQSEIMTYLKTLGGEFFKYPAGKFGKAGVSDIIGCFHGRFIAIEVKRPGCKATELQKSFLRRVEKAGGFGRVDFSVEDVAAFMDNVVKEIYK